MTDAGKEEWMDGLYKRLKAYLEYLKQMNTQS